MYVYTRLIKYVRNIAMSRTHIFFLTENIILPYVCKLAGVLRCRN